MQHQPQLRYKFLYLCDGAICSEHGDTTWQIGKWQEIDGPIETCENGFHCSVKPFDALNYVHGDIIAHVEVAGESDISRDKEAWQRMRIVRAWHWSKEDSVALAIFAAEQVIDLYEKIYPNDTRLRDAIEAAKVCLENPSDAAGHAAISASRAAISASRAAYAAADAAVSAAADAAYAAADAAYAAADAARAAAADAVDAVADAVDAVADAAWAARAARAAHAADEKTLDTINAWVIEHIKVLKPVI